MSSEDEIFHNSRPDKIYASRAFKDYTGKKLRIANKVIDGGPGYEFAKVKEELILRQTDAGRFQIKATFLEDDRAFRAVTIQKFTSKGNAKEYFSFGPGEVNALLKFMANIKKIHFPDDGCLNIRDTDLKELLLEPDQLRRISGPCFGISRESCRKPAQGESRNVLVLQEKSARSDQSACRNQAVYR